MRLKGKRIIGLNPKKKYTKKELLEYRDYLLSKKYKKKKAKKTKQPPDGKYEKVLAYAKSMKARPTSLETKHVGVYHELVSEKNICAKLDTQCVIQKGRSYIIVDFVISINELLIAWEVDGQYHNNIQEKDKKRDLHLKNIGYKVIRTKYFHNNKQVKDLLWSEISKYI
jgi:very-short-patch-repair endonuclease